MKILKSLTEMSEMFYIFARSLPERREQNIDIERYDVSAFLSNLDTLILIGGQRQRLCPVVLTYAPIPDIRTRALLLVHKEGSLRPDKRTRATMFVSFLYFITLNLLIMAKKPSTKALSFTITQQDFDDTVRARSSILPQYVNQESALALLFAKPATFTLSEILLKTAVLNSFYSTGIMDVYAVASHIENLCQNENLKQLLQTGNLSAVTLMKCVNHNGQIINHLSFASKYASFENPNAFPIMDNLVVEVFSRLRMQNFFKKNVHFSKSELKTDYVLFKSVYDEFIVLSGMNKLSNAAGNPLTYKDVDQYLWITKKVQYASDGKNAAKVQLNGSAVNSIQQNPIYIYG